MTKKVCEKVEKSFKNVVQKSVASGVASEIHPPRNRGERASD